MNDRMNNQITNASSTQFPQNEDSYTQKLYLDTNGSCFLCLKETKNDTTDAELLEVSLQSIYRYLNINPHSILLKSLEGDLFSEEDKKEAFYHKSKYLFVVRLCPKCSKMSNNLSKLINQLEMTEMLLKNQLQEYYETLVQSTEREGSESRWNNLQQKMNINSSNPKEICVVENLRHETRISSVAKLESLSKICAHEVEPEKVKSRSYKRKVNQPSEDASQSIASIPSDFPSEIVEKANKRNRIDDVSFIKNGKNVIKDQIDSNKSSDASANSEITNAQEENMVKTNCNYNSPVIEKLAISVKNEKFSKFSIFPHKTKLDYFKMHCKSFEQTNQYECRYCGIYGKNSVNGSLADFSKHLLTQHQEILFASLKLSQLSESEFINCCKTVLDLETVIGKSEAKARGFKSGEQSCSFCRRSYKKTITFKHHFVFKHYNNFVNKLIDFQKNLIKEKVTDNGDCANQVQETNFELVSINTLQTTMDQETMENSQNTDNLGGSSTGDNKIFPNLMNQLVARNNENIFVSNQIPPVFQENLTTTTVSSPFIASSPTFQTQSEYNHFLENILVNHYKLSESAVPKLLCSYCNYITFKHGVINIAIHMVTYHPEKLFILSKFPQLHEKEFFNCCRQVLDSELEKCSRRENVREVYPSSLAKDQASLIFCLICNICYKSKMRFKYHFVFKHINSFEAKLIESQHKVYTSLMSQTESSLENYNSSEKSAHQDMCVAGPSNQVQLTQ